MDRDSAIEEEGGVPVPMENPLEPSSPLKQPPPDVKSTEGAHPAQPILPGDSATTKAEKVERHGYPVTDATVGDFIDSPAKRTKLSHDNSDPSDTRSLNASSAPSASERRRGVAPIKSEYIIARSSAPSAAVDDDAAEASGPRYEANGSAADKRDKKKQKPKGQNTGRTFGSSRDTLQLCSSRALFPEFSPRECKFGSKCKFEHDLRKYLKEGKRDDLKTFGGVCPVWNVRGLCNAGWKCRFAGSHSEERETDDGRRELVLTEDPVRKAKAEKLGITEDEVGVVNVVSTERKIDLNRKRMKTPKADAYTEFLSKTWSENAVHPANGKSSKGNESMDVDSKESRDDNRAQYIEPPFLPSEKRRLYYGPETPVLAPLTTQGNMPFRRLCVELGAQVTWSEMAMGLPLIQGDKGEWALMKAHQTEIQPPKFSSKNTVVAGYDNAKDLKFGAQIAANKPWLALKTTEILTSLCPNLRAIDLNCGCPIDLVYRAGAGSALLDTPGKLEKILRGMNAVSDEVPISVKIRMGTKDNDPTAHKLVKRLILGGQEAYEAGQGAAGVAAITLHGRSRQQRYTRQADWKYISDIAALINRLNKDTDKAADTAAEPDPSQLANSGKVYFLGNGDCYSHLDYFGHIREDKVDSVMIGRGALIKPWIFEEIEKGQYLDKSASERLAYIEKFAKYGLEAWGSDEIGVGTTRRFLLEWLSFSCRYVPIGLLEHMPPHIHDRPPAYRGRDDLETLLASDNYRDWIKISEMFLGPAHPDFKFEPKHKSNSYEIEAEG
ncbi:tRNA-dihydrouridine synthase 3 [Coniosporium tulheliwenetii]|uniref:tRNA-dihydrouridine synthase 3 n=1 Tax=Coniosporium tulheliwenetii TaxID=3383036 RepID=A0ACC2ZEY8_9PEZI|nr:tRNA-dihydrouridine synthase 3 [Cladosporium sp. JES 115]